MQTLGSWNLSARCSRKRSASAGEQAIQRGISLRSELGEPATGVPMLGRCIILTSWVAAHAVGCLLLSAGRAAQDLQTPSAPLPEAPVPARLILSTRLQGQVEKRDSQEQLYLISSCHSVSGFAKSPVPCESPRHITLEEAQAQARTVSSPMAHLAQLQVEAAREARLAAQSEYFPKVSSSS